MSKKTIDFVDNKALVDELVSALDAQTAAETRVKEARKALDEQVRQLRFESERHGVFVTSITARGSNRSGSYQFKNSFKSVNSLEKSNLVAKLGPEAFEELFSEVTELKLRKNLTESQIRVALGDKFDLVFETSPLVKPKKDFLARKFQLIQENPDLHDVCNDVEVDFSHKPQFKAK